MVLHCIFVNEHVVNLLDEIGSGFEGYIAPLKAWFSRDFFRSSRAVSFCW